MDRNLHACMHGVRTKLIKPQKHLYSRPHRQGQNLKPPPPPPRVAPPDWLADLAWSCFAADQWQFLLLLTETEILTERYYYYSYYLQQHLGDKKTTFSCNWWHRCICKPLRQSKKPTLSIRKAIVMIYSPVVFLLGTPKNITYWEKGNGSF